MKTWVQKLIKHKVHVTPIVVRDENGHVLKVLWQARQRGTGRERRGDDPASAANALFQELERNNQDDVSVA